jgi:hypothetical protein
MTVLRIHRLLLSSALSVLIGSAFGFPNASKTIRDEQEFRPPAVPLVTSDPYLSIWSEADHLNDDVTRHWTHRPHPLVSLIRVDGTAYRLMGKQPAGIDALPQTGLEVTPTRSIYHFANDQVKVTLTFMTPALPDDLDIYARPVTYVTWSVQSADGAAHSVQIFDSASSLLSVESPDQQVTCSRETAGSLTLLRTGTVNQPLLSPAGDDTRIDWGYAYLAASKSAASSIGSAESETEAFVKSGSLPADDAQPRPARDQEPVLAYSFDLGKVGSSVASCQVLIGYDELYSIKYYGKKLRPYWRRNGATPASLFQAAQADYAKLEARCKEFDHELSADATSVGGAKYAQIVALSYRECVAANGLAADGNKQPLFFTKENTSNGDIATVDVIFPMDPIWVLLSPTLAKASLVSNFAYAASPHWKFPNAPHDLGTYPLVFGRDDGGEGMPVEESGNMIILTDAIAHAEGNAKFATQWWPQLTQWAKYLEKYGLDPEDQLCTDDFMGHLAHNANLSVKAILALAAYGDLCHLRGDEVNAKRYFDLARADAAHWATVADAGDHSLLAFDQPGTWSQKYNLVWDQVLGLNIFPKEIAAKEIAYYQKVMLPYGFPLDSRTHLTKTDWSIWSATMATDRDTFESLVEPIYRYLAETSARDPIADSYVTDDIKSGGMHARPVVGGFFVRLLTDQAIWHKWASRDHFKLGTYAPLPVPPKVTEVVPTARTTKVSWHYTTVKPADGWTQPGFDDSSWPQGNAGFGTEGTPDAIVGTNWNTDDIWIRRTLTLPKIDGKRLKLVIYHDEDVEVYVNGVLAHSEPGYMNSYEVYDISEPAKRLLTSGAQITLAAHCHQTTGGQGVDVGFVEVSAADQD